MFEVFIYQINKKKHNVENTLKNNKKITKPHRIINIFSVQ